MRRLLFLFLGCFCMVTAQENQPWKGYFSYNEIKDISQSDNKFFAAAENALFSKNLATNVLKTTNTIDGLSGQTITALYHSTTFNKTMVGYENGLIIVINEADGTMVNVVDIINKQLPPNIKKVNHFAEHNGIVYVSCDFGIVQYNLATLLFGDTYFIGDNGDEIIVSQSTIFNGFIYAATNFGIRRADITNPNLNDFSQWTTIATGSWTGVEALNTEMMAVTSNGQINRYNGTNFSVQSQLPLPARDVRSAAGHFIVATASAIYVYNQTFGIVSQVSANQVSGMNPVFTSATVVGGTLFIGSQENGVLTTELNNPTAFVSISPDGPSRNNVFSINASPSFLYATYGAYDIDFVPQMQQHGISKYTGNSWLNIPYEEVHATGKEAFDLVRTVVNPNNENQLYVASYHSGLLKFENDELVMQYDHTNSGLESLVYAPSPNYRSVRIELGAFDRQGNLWMTNAQIEDALKVLKPDGNWVSYNMESILSGTSRFGRMIIDKNGTKWMGSYDNGLIGFNENGNVFKKISFGPDQGNLPFSYVGAIAVDNRNQLWIGTLKGLRVLSSVDRFMTDDQMTTSPIIILEDDVAQELLYEQFITDIVVDGANNKWIGTADSGVFLVSPNGQETIHRFTSANSPLPSNNINDIDINGATGEVFIATSKGLVSFKGTSTDASENLSKVFVYPNPVRPEFHGTVKISGLTDKANVKIADIEGNLVYEQIAEGGTIEWDTKAFGKYRVASGVYMIFISTESGEETKVKKVMVVR